MEIPVVNQETVHGNLGLQRHLVAAVQFSRNVSTGYIVGNKWYVNGDVAGSGDGKSWEKAVKTIAEANTLASDDDVIYIAPGTYVITSNILFTQTNLKIFGFSGQPGVASIGTNIDATGCDSFGIDGNNVEVAYLTFVGAENYWMIDVPGTDTADPTGVWIHHCYFYATEQGSCKGVSLGNRAGDAGNAISGVVEDCYFFKCGDPALNLDGSRAAVRRNTFIIMHPRTAILCPQSGSERNSNEILDNIFVAYGTANEQKGINFSGATSPTVGTMWVDGNRFINFASATLACNKLLGYGGMNFFNHQYLTAANPPVATTIS